MTPLFALDLNQQAITLLAPDEAGWEELGQASPESAAFEQEMAALRAKAEAYAESRGLAGPLTTSLVIPGSQVLYLDLAHAASSEARARAHISEALEGRTPYGLADLTYDFLQKDGRLQVAVVARETLAEAEAFAAAQGFAPLCFLAWPDRGTYEGAPYFGAAAGAAALLAEPEPEAEAPLEDAGVAPVSEEAVPTEAESEIDFHAGQDEPVELAEVIESAPSEASVPDDWSELPPESSVDQAEEEAAGQIEAELAAPEQAAPGEEVLSAAQGETEAPVSAKEVGSEIAPADAPEPIRAGAATVAAAALAEPVITAVERVAPAPTITDIRVSRPEASVTAPALQVPPEQGADLPARRFTLSAPGKSGPAKAPSAKGLAARLGDARLPKPGKSAAAAAKPAMGALAGRLSGKGAAPAAAQAEPAEAPFWSDAGSGASSASWTPSPVASRGAAKAAPTSAFARAPRASVTAARPGLGFWLIGALVLFMGSVALWAGMGSSDDPAPAVEAPVTGEAPALASDPEALADGEPAPATSGDPAAVPRAAELATEAAPAEPAPVEVVQVEPVQPEPGLPAATVPAPDVTASSSGTASGAVVETAAPLLAGDPAPTALPTPPAPLGDVLHDAAPQSAPPAPPFGTEIRVGPDGAILPVPEGVVTPDGITLFAGAPGRKPATRPQAVADAGALLSQVVSGAPLGTAPEAEQTVAAPAAEPPPAADPALAGKRPKARPAQLVPAPQGALETPPTESLPAADPALAGKRPTARPTALATAAPTETEPPAATFADATETAPTLSRRPTGRPSTLRKAVDAAVVAALAEAAPPPPAPEPPAAEVVVASAPAPTPKPAAKPAPPPEPAPEPAKPTRSSPSPAPEPTVIPGPEDEGEEAVATAGAPAATTASRGTVAKRATVANAIDLGSVALLGISGTSSSRRALVRLPSGKVQRVKIGDRLDGGKVAAISDKQVVYVKGGRQITLQMPRKT